MQFFNYEAADRRGNIIPFGLLPANSNLSWIQDSFPVPQTTALTYAASVAIDVTTAQIRYVTLTGDMDITAITYGGSATIPAPSLLSLIINQDSVGGHIVTLPASVVLNIEFQINLTPYGETVLNLIYFGTHWELMNPPSFNL